MSRLGDDRDAAGQAVPRGEADVMRVAKAVRECSTELRRAFGLADANELDLAAWEESGMPALLTDLRESIKRLDDRIRGS